MLEVIVVELEGGLVGMVLDVVGKELGTSVGCRCMTVVSRVVKVGVVLEVVEQLVVIVQVPATCFGNHIPSLP